MTTSVREMGLDALGWYLDQRHVRDAFIAVDAEGVTVMPIRAATAGTPRRVRHRHLLRLAGLSRRRAAAPAAGGLPRQALLALAGREMDRRGGHLAFIVLYEDLLIVDFDGYGPAQRIIYSANSLPGDGAAEAALSASLVAG